ncbi:MAG: NAD(+) diphosphatase, partial [Clostridia bacterium]|nr:NAD(+) diphosphatase [Clostridia bacterium]
MFQDIKPHQLQIELQNRLPAATDYIFISRQGKVLLAEKNGQLTLPQYQTIQKAYPGIVDIEIYLFSVDNTALFLSMDEAPESSGLSYYPITAFRELEPAWLAFAGATAAHLASWYKVNRYCGCCATPFQHKGDERALICPSCKHIEFPKIAPVIIVAIIDGDRILLAKSASGYQHYGLIAGFVEIGEALEDTVRREIMEEVGLRVKNIRYFKSQPWAFSESLLSGFFADLDGDDTIRLNTAELAAAEWFPR